MLKEKDDLVRRLMISVDMFILFAAYWISYAFRANIRTFYRADVFPGRVIIAEAQGTFSEHLVFIILLIPVWCFFLYRSGAYTSWRLLKGPQVVWIVTKATSFTVFFAGAALFLLKVQFVSRLLFLTFATLGFLVLVAEKLVVLSAMRAVRKGGYNSQQILIIGTGRRAEEFARKIKARPEWGLRIIGAVEDEPGRGIKSVAGIDVLGDLMDIPDILHSVPVDEVVIVIPRSRLNHVEGAIHECEIEGVKVTLAVDLFDLKIAKAQQSEIAGIPLLTFKTTVPSEWQLLAKRAMDIMISGLLIVCLSPLLLVIALMIRLTSPGPVLFRQERVGLNKKRFVILKFRTMLLAAQKELPFVDIYKEIYESRWRDRKLSYVTPVGRMLRKFSLDELPQLFNVFRGDMSLVGPRPTLPQEVDQYQTWFRRRFSMRPGVTCLWQISGRRDIQLAKWMEMDLEYLDNWSLWLDIKILFKTIPAVLMSRGAY